MSNERKELGTSSQEQFDIPSSQKIRQQSHILRPCPKVPTYKAPNKKGTEKTFLAGGAELISMFLGWIAK